MRAAGHIPLTWQLLALAGLMVAAVARSLGAW